MKNLKITGIIFLIIIMISFFYPMASGNFNYQKETIEKNDYNALNIDYEPKGLLIEYPLLIIETDFSADYGYVEDYLLFGLHINFEPDEFTGKNDYIKITRPFRPNTPDLFRPPQDDEMYLDYDVYIRFFSGSAEVVNGRVIVSGFGIMGRMLL
jgi:hypothetical protein